MITKTDRLAMPGEGEQAERASRRMTNGVKGALFAIGLVTGGYLGYFLAANDFDLSAGWPPEIAVTFAIVYVVAILGGSWLLRNRIDEVERANTYKAVSVAGTAYMLVYPVWFLLWLGGMLVEPIHWALFIMFWLLLIGSALFYRFR